MSKQTKPKQQPRNDRFFGDRAEIGDDLVLEGAMVFDAKVGGLIHLEADDDGNPKTKAFYPAHVVRRVSVELAVEKPADPEV